MATLYRKYRPEHWSDVSGQPHIVTTLTNAIAGNLVAHAYLFTGPRGTGKTSVARLFAKSINCTDHQGGKEPCETCVNCRAFSEGRAFDIIEIDGASNNGVENIRELRETVKLPPAIGTKKIYIIDEAHMLSSGAWNALLKTLEEPPEHAIFILATTELHKIPATISSRCQRFDFGRFSVSVIIEKLSRIAESEHVTVDTDALEMIALAAEGGMRDAESLLSQVIALEDKHITGAETATILGITERKTVVDFVSALGSRDLDSAILTLESLVKKGIDFRSFTGTLTHFLHEILFRKLGDAAKNSLVSSSSEDAATLTELSEKFSFADLARLMELIHHARAEVRHAALQQVPLEIATLAFLFPEDIAEAMQPSRSESETPRTSPSRKEIPKESPKADDTPKEQPESDSAKESIKSLKASPSLPAVEPSAKEESSETTAPNSSLTVADIRSKWNTFLEEIKRQNASLSLALSGSEPGKLEGDSIGVSVRHAFLKERLEKPKSRLTVGEVLATIFGTPLRLTVDVVPEEPTPADPILDSAVNILGGRVVPS